MQNCAQYARLQDSTAVSFRSSLFQGDGRRRIIDGYRCFRMSSVLLADGTYTIFRRVENNPRNCESQRCRKAKTSTRNRWQLQNVPGINLYLRNNKSLQLFNVIVLQTSPLVQLYTSASHCKGVGNIPGRHFVKDFLALTSHSEWCLLHLKSFVLSVLISVKDTGKNRMQLGQESTGDDSVLSHCSLLRCPRLKPIVVLEHCCEGETNCWFSIFRGLSFWPRP
jgi:hypothetical protein